MNRRIRTISIALAVVAVLGVAGFAQQAATTAPETLAARVLLIDESRTFATTMRVGALAGILRDVGVDLEVRLESVSTSYVDPLAEAVVPDEPFDLILIVPAGIDDGTVHEVWLLYSHRTATSPEALSVLEPLHALLGAVFDGIGTPADVAEDLWVGLLASYYEMRGWLR